MSDFEHLVPKSARGHLSKVDREELVADRQEGKEFRFVLETLRALGWSRSRVYKQAEREGGRLDFVWVWNERLTPIHMSYAEIQKLDILQLYTTPTKTPVYRAFVSKLKTVKDNTDEEELIMPFTCRNINQRAFAMHNVDTLLQDSRVYLTFVVRGTRHFVHPWKEVVSVIKQRWGPEQGLEAQAF